jgi:ketosteroid isomerase-like protein
MSQENVEIVRAAYETFNRDGMEVALAGWAPDFVWDMSRAVGFDRGVHNLDDTRRILRDFLELWESSHFEASELIDAGEQVVVRYTNRHQGRDGMEVVAQGYWVWTIRDGVIAGQCAYQERAEALEAVGLSE